MALEKIVVIVAKELEEIMPGFLQNRKKDIVELAKHIIAKDFKSMQVIGHNLSGNAGGYGLERLGEFGSNLEKASISSDSAKAKVCVDQITDYVTRLEIKFK